MHDVLTSQTPVQYCLILITVAKFLKKFQKSLKLVPEVLAYFTTMKFPFQICKLKAHVPMSLKSDVIYEISFQRCGGSYIGQILKIKR